ncbi:MAG: hypothetical protein AAB869_01665 [Patescibacteria group bacterium]
MPAFVDADIMLANCFDDFGSDAIAHDECDPEHSYWVDIDEVDELMLHPDYLRMIGADETAYERDDRIFADDPTDPPASKVADGTAHVAALVAKFSQPKTGEAERKRHTVSYKGEPPKPTKGFVARLRYNPKSRCHVLGQQAKVTVRKHRHVDGDELCKDVTAFMAMPKKLRDHLATISC